MTGEIVHADGRVELADASSIEGSPLYNEDLAPVPVKLVGKFTNPLIVAVSMFSVVVATLAVNIAANVVSPANDFANAPSWRRSPAARWPGEVSSQSGWLYRPKGAKGPGPIVLSFHGGPEGQEVPSFRADYQALVSRGIAVLRGPTRRRQFQDVLQAHRGLDGRDLEDRIWRPRHAGRDARPALAAL